MIAYPTKQWNHLSPSQTQTMMSDCNGRRHAGLKNDEMFLGCAPLDVDWLGPSMECGVSGSDLSEEIDPTLDNEGAWSKEWNNTPPLQS
eukprot:scaffold170038_cov45-Attheya_sp.AAC.4